MNTREGGSLRPEKEKVGLTNRDRGETARLTGRMGAGSLALSVLAFSAPMAVVSGFIPFTILFDGVGATFGFILTTVLLILFAIGYVTMAKHVPKPGDFYAFISSGLGKVVGLGCAFLSVLSYVVVLAGVYAFTGIAVSSLITSLHGPDTTWWIWAVIAWVVVSTLGYFHIELSAKILSFSLVAEVLVVMIFNVFVLAKGGAEGLSWTPLTPSAFAHGDMPVTFLYCILVFMGFEATALFRDEVRDPDKTIPRATYFAVVFVGTLYALSSYTLISAYGHQAVDVATRSPATMFPAAIGKFVGPIFTQISYAFVVLSNFAALVAVHNVLARYVFNLSEDKALPSYFSAVHDYHHSPYRASTAVAVVVAIGMLPFILNKTSGDTLYARLTGLGSIGVVVLMALVSLSVVAWFARKGVPSGENAFKCFIAPAVAFTSLAAVSVFGLLHFDLVVGGNPGENNVLELVLAGALVVGAVLAMYFRSSKPHVYDGLGRAQRMLE